MTGEKDEKYQAIQLALQTAQQERDATQKELAAVFTLFEVDNIVDVETVDRVSSVSWLERDNGFTIMRQ